MKIHRWLARVLLLLLMVRGWASDIAIVHESKVNVRGQPALAGEVITQLNKGDHVNVLEEITIEKPKAGEPAKWAKIKMPANTPVWVFASFIDPATKTVAARRLNLRAGPGENYSPIGRLQKGDPVKEIRTVEDWMEIETPESAYAFIAAGCFDRAANAPLAETKTAPPETPAASTVLPLVVPPATAPPETVPTPIPPTDLKLEAAPPKIPETTNAVAAIIAPPVEPKSEPAPEPVKPKVEASPRRIVRREGIVRSTGSIQAPTYTELISSETRRTMNWLHEEKSGIKLKEFRGQKVIVTGEEGIDPRWPKVPVIEVETIQLAP